VGAAVETVGGVDGFSLAGMRSGSGAVTAGWARTGAGGDLPMGLEPGPTGVASG
jgi:hypothetical protein